MYGLFWACFCCNLASPQVPPKFPQYPQSKGCVNCFELAPG